MLVWGVPLGHVNFIHAMIPARDTVFTYYFISSLQMLYPQIWNIRTFFTIIVSISVANILDNFHALIHRDFALHVAQNIFVAVALLEILVTTILFFRML